MADNSLNYELSACFNMKPEEIFKYFENKGLKTSYNWYDVYNEAHAKAFTVAKMTEIDLLKDTKKLLEKSIDEGKSFSSFKSEAQELFSKKGWIGHKEVVNPKTGEKETVELGTPSRIKKIYDCNLNSAYAVGRYREQLEDIDVAPYLQYMAIMDESTRPEHRALHGKVYRADDPFWSMFYPPNGWNCRCFARSLTKYQVEKQGLKVGSTDGKISYITEKVGDKEVEIPIYKFDDTGVIRTLKPDKGWEGNLGIQAWGIDVQAWNKVEGLSENLKLQFISKMASNPYTEKVFLDMVEKVVNNDFRTDKKIEKTVGWLRPVTTKMLLKNDIKLATPIVVLQEKQIPHVIGDRQKLTKDELLKAYDIIKNPDSVYIDYTRSKSGTYGLAYIRDIPNSDKCIKVCVKLSKKSNITKDIVNYISTSGIVAKNDVRKSNLFKRIE